MTGNQEVEAAVSYDEARALSLGHRMAAYLLKKNKEKKRNHKEN